MGDVSGRFLQFATDYGVYFAGIAALISYLSEVYSSLRRTGPATAWSNVKMIARLIVTTVSVAVAFFIISAQYEKKTSVAKAADDIVFTYHDCLDATKVISFGEIARMARARRPVQLQCLAYAVNKNAPDHASEKSSVALAEDEELGHRLLDDPAKEDGIADTLYDSFGVNSETFLGTGYSVPRSRSDDEIRYGDARMREYLVANFCAERFPPDCIQRHDTMWSWTIEPKRLAEYSSVRSFLLHRDANEGAGDFRDTWDRQGGDGANWLIRFQMFPKSRYKGTVGRPSATYVFFSGMDQALNLSLTDAVRNSGSTMKEIDNASDDKMVFVWVAAPAETGDYTRIATWQNVFLLLKSVDVWPSVRHIMADRKPPLLRSLRAKPAP